MSDQAPKMLKSAGAPPVTPLAELVLRCLEMRRKRETAPVIPLHDNKGSTLSTF